MAGLINGTSRDIPGHCPDVPQRDGQGHNPIGVSRCPVCPAASRRGILVGIELIMPKRALSVGKFSLRLLAHVNGIACRRSSDSGHTTCGDEIQRVTSARWSHQPKSPMLSDGLACGVQRMTNIQRWRSTPTFHTREISPQKDRGGVGVGEKPKPRCIFEVHLNFRAVAIQNWALAS